MKDDIETGIISNFGIPQFNESLRRAICVFNKVIALYKLSKAKDGNDYIVLFSSIIGDILKLTEFDNKLKNTFLYKIKMNGNQIIKKYSDLVSISTSVFTFCYYLYEGDTEYAILDFSCDILFLLLTTAFTGIFVGIIFFFLKIGTNYLINQCKTDDYEKWAMCNNYGKLHESLMNENIWKHRIYKNYIEDFPSDIQKYTPKWYASALEQIKTYYKLGINLKVEFCPCTYNMSDNICEENYESFNLLKIDITTNMFYKDDLFKIDFEIKKMKKNFSFILKNNDLNIYYDNKKGGYKIVIILVNDISMISNYLLEELMMEYSSYAIKPKKIHFVEAREFLSECSKGVFRYDSYVKHRFEYHSSYYNDMGESPLLCKEGIDYVPMRYFNYECQ